MLSIFSLITLGLLYRIFNVNFVLLSESLVILKLYSPTPFSRYRSTWVTRTGWLVAGRPHGQGHPVPRTGAPARRPKWITRQRCERISREHASLTKFEPPTQTMVTWLKSAVDEDRAGLVLGSYQDRAKSRRRASRCAGRGSYMNRWPTGLNLRQWLSRKGSTVELIFYRVLVCVC